MYYAMSCIQFFIKNFNHMSLHTVYICQWLLSGENVLEQILFTQHNDLKKNGILYNILLFKPNFEVKIVLNVNFPGSWSKMI